MKMQAISTHDSKKCSLRYKERISFPTSEEQIISHCISIELASLEGKLSFFINNLFSRIRPQYPDYIFRITQGFFNLHIHVMPTRKLDEPIKTLGILENAIRKAV